MRHKKKLKDLTFKDNFMFGAVMTDENNCRDFLELTLEFPIARVEVCKEKTFMQVVQKEALEKRTRYYHSEIDMELLLSGMDYTELPEVYVIFICDFDPFGRGRYCYTFENCCVEDSTLKLRDGCRSIFLSTCGTNDNEVSDSMITFLHFVKADLKESTKDFQDDFVKRLQSSVAHIKINREMEGRFMLLQELLKDEHLDGKNEGKIEGKTEAKIECIFEVLENLGTIPENTREKINLEKDLSVLNSWHKLAVRSDSIEHFIQQM